MSRPSPLPPVARCYLDELAHELRFAPRYAHDVRAEIEAHFCEALAESDEPQEHVVASLVGGFGNPWCLAVDFAAVLLTRNLRNTLLLDAAVTGVIMLAVTQCLFNPLSIFCMLAAAMCILFSSGWLARIQRQPADGLDSWRRLCPPIGASHLASALLAFSLLWNLYEAGWRWHGWPLLEGLLTLILLGRMIAVRRQNKKMCALRQRVSETLS